MPQSGGGPSQCGGQLMQCTLPFRQGCPSHLRECGCRWCAQCVLVVALEYPWLCSCLYMSSWVQLSYTRARLGLGS